MNYRIVSDSGSNLRKLDSDIAFASVPLKISTDEREFVDDSALQVDEMITYLDGYKGKSGTACPGIGEWLEAFGEADAVFCFTITSTLSGSCNAARLAGEEYEAEHPGRHVCIVDSLSAGPEMKLLIEKLLELIGQGMEYEMICKEIMEYKEHTGLLFSLESLKNLANNGRVSPAVAKIAGVLGIRVVGCASERGELEPMDKCRGEKKALPAVIRHMKEMGYAGGHVRIDHCCNAAAAEKLAHTLQGEYPQADIRIGETFGLCSFYAEKGGLMIGFEKK
ncbi:MAG: DegV family protein [Lachnospiraceae bacterium]|nr:DegV family protein [Lachnospiraceae bacterium]